MKYLVIYDGDGGGDVTSKDIEVWDFKKDDLSQFMEDRWDRDCAVPIVIPVTTIKEVLARKGVNTL